MLSLWNMLNVVFETKALNWNLINTWTFCIYFFVYNFVQYQWQNYGVIIKPGLLIFQLWAQRIYSSLIWHWKVMNGNRKNDCFKCWLWVLKGSGSSKCVFLKIILFPWNIFFLTSVLYPALFEFGGWGEIVVKAFWIGMLWNSKCRFLGRHFINGSLGTYLIKNFWEWRLVLLILKASVLGSLCFKCLFLVFISFSFFPPNFGNLVVLSFFYINFMVLFLHGIACI